MVSVVERFHYTSTCVVNGWNKPDPDISSSSPEGVLCNATLNFIRPITRNTYSFDGCFGSLSN